MESLCKRGALLILTLVIVLQSQCCLADKYLANDSYTYRVNFTNGTSCMTVSMNANIVIYYRSVNITSNGTSTVTLTTKQFVLPSKNETTVTSNCTDSTRIISLLWENDNSTVEASFNFSVLHSEWYLAQVDISFDMDDASFELPEVTGLQSYVTTDGKRMFNRTFGSNQYFHCKACKRLWLRVNNEDTHENNSGPCYTELVDDVNSTMCSHLFLQNSVMFPGNLDSNNHVSKKLCLEDFIDLQEIIIPAAVGGILGLLLLLVFSSYLVAFIRRKRREGQYETINDSY